MLPPEVGQRGEQVTMIILLRTYAAAVESQCNIKRVSDNPQMAAFDYCQSVPLVALLEVLFKKEYHVTIVGVQPHNIMGGPKLNEAFKHARVQFNHFVHAENTTAMTAESAFVMYLHCAAILGSQQNQAFDIMVPILMLSSPILKRGEEQLLDWAQISMMMISIKRHCNMGKGINTPINKGVIPFFPFGASDCNLQVDLNMPYILLGINLTALKY